MKMLEIKSDADLQLMNGDLAGRVDVDVEISEVEALGIFIANPELTQLSCPSGYYLRPV